MVITVAASRMPTALLRLHVGFKVVVKTLCTLLFAILFVNLVVLYIETSARIFQRIWPHIHTSAPVRPKLS